MRNSARVTSLASERVRDGGSSVADDMLDQIHVLGRLLDAMDDAGWRWTIFGGFASLLAGRSDGFKDVDVIVDMSEAEIIGLLGSFGLTTVTKPGSVAASCGRGVFEFVRREVMHDMGCPWYYEYGELRQSHAFEFRSGSMVYNNGHRTGYMNSPLRAMWEMNEATKFGVTPDFMTLREILSKARGILYPKVLNMILWSSRFPAFLASMDVIGGWDAFRVLTPFRSGRTRSRAEEAATRLKISHHGTFWRHVFGSDLEDGFRDCGLPEDWVSMVSREMERSGDVELLDHTRPSAEDWVGARIVDAQLFDLTFLTARTSAS